jgi:hypothetical protein
MITLTDEDLTIAPVRVLGDGVVRLDHVSRGALSPDGRTLSLSRRNAIVELDLDRWVTKAVHRRDRASNSKNAANLSGPVFTYARDGNAVTLCDARGGSRTFTAPAFDDGAVLAAPDRDDELFVYCSRSIARLRIEGDSLTVEAQHAREGARADFGFTLHELAFSPDRATLFVRTDRDVIRLDRATLRPIEPAVVFDINAHRNDPRAWVDTNALAAMRLHDDALLLLTNQRHAKAKVLRVSLRDRSVIERTAPPEMVLSSMSEVMANGRLLLRGLSGWVVMDPSTLEITDVLARTTPANSRWTDVARSIDYAVESDGAFVTARFDPRIAVTSREGVVSRSRLRWNSDHIVALSPQRGLERFDPSGASVSRVDGAEHTPLSRLSPEGRWAIVVRQGALVAERVDDPAQRAQLAQQAPSWTDVPRFAVTDDGATFRWDGRALHIDGAAVPIAKRETRAELALSRDGRLVALATSKEIIVVDVAQRKERCRIAAPKRAITQFAGDRWLVVTGADGLRWFDRETAALSHWHKRRFSTEVYSCASPDGALLALIADRGVVELVVRDDPSASRSIIAAESVHSVAFSPDASQLVVASSESVLRIFSVPAALATRSPSRKRAR